MADGRLAGKVAIVTGGGSGIGAAIAQGLHAAGALVAIADISGKEEEVAAELGDGAIAVSTDVADDGAVAALVRRTVSEFGRLDALYNNAGIDGNLSALADYTLEEFDRVLAVNARAVFSGTRYALPVMVSQGCGSIVNTASVAGLIAFPGLSAYCASKAAVIGLTRSTAVEYGRSGVRCNAICPGVVKTTMLTELEERHPDVLKALLHTTETTTPLGRLGLPMEIASVAVFLASDESTFLTGAVIPVDGGYTAV